MNGDDYVSFHDILYELKTDNFNQVLDDHFESLLFFIPRKYIEYHLKSKNLYNLVYDYYTEILARK
jgi:hypothetical protein